MIQTKTIILCFLGVLGLYLTLRFGLLLQYLTLAQLLVALAGLAFAVFAGYRRGVSLRQFRAPRENKDLRLFLLGKNMVLLNIFLLLVLSALSLLPGAPFYWNLEQKVELAGLPEGLTRQQIIVLNQFITKYEASVKAGTKPEFLDQTRKEGVVPLWIAALPYTRNLLLRRDLLTLLEGATGLALLPEGELTDGAVQPVVSRLLDWQKAQPHTPQPKQPPFAR